MSYSEKKLRELEVRNAEMEGIIADQNAEILELKKQIFDLENEVVWPVLEER